MPNGFSCPHCAGKTRVLKTWTKIAESIFRLRRCITCGVTFNTSENRRGKVRNLPAKTGHK